MFIRYMLAVNAVSIILFLVSLLLRFRRGGKLLEKILYAAALLGGTPGILLMILLFDRKAEKRNMMARVYFLCVFVIQVLLVLLVKGGRADHFSLSFLTFFRKHQIFTIYLCVMNVITFAAFGIDKLKAIKHRSRIRIVTLLGMAALGGSIGGLTGMYLFRHKTKKVYFTAGIPLILLTQVVLLVFVMNFRIFR